MYAMPKIGNVISVQKTGQRQNQRNPNETTMNEKNNKKPLIENQPYICCCGEGKKRMNAEIFRGIHSLSVYFIITTGIMYVGVVVVLVLAFKSNEIFSISL